jgi:hypothetical protein
MLLRILHLGSRGQQAAYQTTQICWPKKIYLPLPASVGPTDGYLFLPNHTPLSLSFVEHRPPCTRGVLPPVRLSGPGMSSCGRGVAQSSSPVRPPAPAWARRIPGTASLAWLPARHGSVPPLWHGFLCRRKHERSRRSGPGVVTCPRCGFPARRGLLRRRGHLPLAGTVDPSVADLAWWPAQHGDMPPV